MDNITIKIPILSDQNWKLLQHIISDMLRDLTDHNDTRYRKLTWGQVVEFLAEQGFKVSIDSSACELTTTEQDLVAMRLKWG